MYKKEKFLQSYQNGVLSQFSPKESEELLASFNTSLKKLALPKVSIKTEILIVNKKVAVIDQKIAVAQLKKLTIQNEQSTYHFYSSKGKLVSFNIKIQREGYTHHFWYYFDIQEKILKYLKFTKVQNPLRNQLDLERRAIFFHQNGEVIWSNTLFDPPVQSQSIKGFFNFFQKINISFQTF